MLAKGMYGHEFDRTGNQFGLRCGQMRRNDLVHNGGWYNKEGEKLGWGDLSEADLITIRDGLEESDVFIILSEMDSYWNFPVQAKQEGTSEAPGKKYVAEHAKFYITKGTIHSVISPYDSARKHGEVNGIFTYATRKTLLTLLLKGK